MHYLAYKFNALLAAFFHGCLSNTTHHSMSLWRLILYVNLTCLRDTHIAGKTLFLDVTTGVFLEEISIRIHGLREEDHLHHCRWASPNLLRACRRTKRQRQGKCFSAWAKTIIFLCPETSMFLVLGPSDSDQDLCHQLPWSSQPFRPELTPLVLRPLDLD